MLGVALGATLLIDIITEDNDALDDTDVSAYDKLPEKDIEYEDVSPLLCECDHDHEGIELSDTTFNKSSDGSGVGGIEEGIDEYDIGYEVLKAQGSTGKVVGAIE